MEENESFIMRKWAFREKKMKIFGRKGGYMKKDRILRRK